jgi:hypothetical protein
MEATFFSRAFLPAYETTRTRCHSVASMLLSHIIYIRSPTFTEDLGNKQLCKLRPVDISDLRHRRTERKHL